MTWLPIGVYRTFPLPILPVPPLPPRRIFKYRIEAGNVKVAPEPVSANTAAKIEVVPKPIMQ